MASNGTALAGTRSGRHSGGRSKARSVNRASRCPLLHNRPLGNSDIYTRVKASKWLQDSRDAISQNSATLCNRFCTQLRVAMRQ